MGAGMMERRHPINERHAHGATMVNNSRKSIATPSARSTL